MNPDTDIKEFCQKYEAVVGPSNRLHRRVRRLDYTAFKEHGPELWDRVPYHDEKCVEIHMPADRFRALLEHDEWVSKAGLQDNNFFNNNVSRVAQMVVEHERECRIRQENPAVKKAYEKYLMLLHTVSSYYE